MDPLALIVWGAVGIVALVVLLTAVRLFGRFLIMVLAIAALLLLLDFVADPHAAMNQVTTFASQVNAFIEQLRSSFHEFPISR